MKTASLFSLLVCFTYFTSYSQGIYFHNGTWKEAIIKAKQEHKIIYLDVYTTWCGPCKMMATKFFPNKEVGTFYNHNFINVSIDAEKGEGLVIAKQYNVVGYPTNLFIDPENEDVIFKTIGAPMEKEGFIENAKIAIEEYQDPMKLSEYESEFSSQKYSESFLKKYILKLERLDKLRDKEIDAYLDKFSSKEHPDSLTSFLLKVVATMNNKGFDLLIKDENKLPKYIGVKPTRNTYVDRLMFASIESSINNSNEKIFTNSLNKFQQIFPHDTERYLYFQKYYYDQTKNESNILKANIEYGDFLMSKSLDEINKQDNLEFNDFKAKMLWTIKQNIDSPKEQELALNKKIADRPECSHFATSNMADELNSMAWQVFEKNRSNKVLAQKALLWAKKASELGAVDDISTQLAIKDTYANLLFVNGKIDEAIQLESSLIEIIKKENLDGLNSFQETLQKMKDGKL